MSIRDSAHSLATKDKGDISAAVASAYCTRRLSDPSSGYIGSSDSMWEAFLSTQWAKLRFGISFV